MKCLTCTLIKALDASYPAREAVHGEHSGRCQWHAWDSDHVFVCTHCKNPRFFEQVAWCPKTNTFICTACSPSRVVEAPFWFWKRYSIVTCPHCGGEHPTLNRQEAQGEHPWQADPYHSHQFPVWYPGGRIVEEEDITTKKVVCPSCRSPLPVRTPGIYQCPHCQQVLMVRKKAKS